jgi:ATP-dependent DNA helicase RecG
MEVWNDSTPLEDFLSATKQIYALTPPFAVAEPMTQRLCPRNFTLLLFGKNLQKFFPGAYTVFSIYRGEDRSEPNAEKHEIIGSVVYQARRCIELLNAESYTIFDKQSETPNQKKYPQRALQEAVINALVHRDYESEQPMRITVFSDRIEFNSPGALPRSVDKEKFVSGRASPHWRNQSLAFFFNKLQLAQAEGQGIPTIFRTMKEEGCPEPIFEFGTDNVVCVLPAHPRHKQTQERFNP